MIESNFIDKLNSFNKLFEVGFQGYNKHPYSRIPKGNIVPEFQGIFSLVYNYEFEHYYFSLIRIDSEILENDKYFMFAKNLVHGLDYVLNKKTKEVEILDECGELTFSCCQDVKSFFVVACLLLDLEIAYCSENQIDDATIDLFRMKCIEAAGGVAYKSYYDLIV